ncbi:hypothetical protein EDB84DRAFT_1534087 [Lactarius hengduanensis]|nr:hypothetical protein EDB84DRAFT_1534087 [Lactarius hengduanensis]
MAPRTTRPLLITVIGLKDTRYAAELKARQGLIKKHGPSKEIESRGDFFILSSQCPHHVERVGVLGDGGKRVCGMERFAKQANVSSTRSVVTAGINGESSFKAALLEHYDFTVDSARAHFFPWALGGRNAHGPEDSPKYYTFDETKRQACLSHSLVASHSLLSCGNPCHTFIDVLKIDVEGAEFDTLTVFLETHKLLSPFSSTMLPIGQLQIELHVWDNYGKFDFFHDWWAALEAASLRPFWTESNLVYMNYNAGGKPRLAEYSFMNIRGNHSLVYEAADGADAYYSS